MGWLNENHYHLVGQKQNFPEKKTFMSVMLLACIQILLLFFLYFCIYEIFFIPVVIVGILNSFEKRFTE